ncbi:hypothetical protein Tco_0777311 [Tanacetum coccineum]
MSNMSEDIQYAGSDTRPPMLDRTDFESWQQRIRLYCLGKDNGENIMKSITEGPFQMGKFIQTPTEETEGALQLGPKRARVFTDLFAKEKERYKVDIRATNILLQGIPKDIYILINHYTDAKDIWDNVKMILEGFELTKDDKESQLYDEFEHFCQIKGETIHVYYVRFTKLINDMRHIKMTMPRTQLNSKFVNNMLPEWSRFITEVKLNRGLKESNFNQLYAYLKQHEVHASKNRMMMERFIQPTNDPLAIVSNASVQQTSSNAMNKATVQDGRVVVQDVRGRYNANNQGRPFQRNNTRGNVVAGNAGGQNRGGNVNPGEQVTNFDDDVDDPNEKDLALNVDHIFEADQCDAFDSDVDEAPNIQTMFMVNLSSEDPIYDEAGPSYDSNTPFEVQDHDTFVDHMDEYHEVHEMQNDVQHNYVVDSDAEYASDSNIILYNQYMEDNEEHVVQSNVSSVRNDALMSIIDDMHEQGVQSMSANKQVKVVNDTLTSELARYKELVGVYEKRTKFELTEREQKIDEQMRIIISDRNRKETSLKLELHTVQMQLRSTVDHNKSMKEEVTTLKKDFKQKEDKYIEEFLDIKKLKEKVEDRLFKQDQSVQTVHMLCKPKPFYDEKKKVAIGYKNPLCSHVQSKFNLPSIMAKDENDGKKVEASVLKPLSTSTVYPPNTPVKLVPKVLPTKIQVKINLYTLTQLFTEFDKTCKKRITPTSLTEGERGFEKTKRCYLAEVIPFFKTLKQHFEGVQKALFKEVKEMEEIFDQMSTEVDQNTMDMQCAETERKNLLIANENLIANCLSNQLMFVVEQSRCLDLEVEISKLQNENKKDVNDEMIRETQLQEKDNAIRNLKAQVSKMNDRSCETYNAKDVTALIEQNECVRVELEKSLKAQLKSKVSCVTSDSVKPKVLAPSMYAIDVKPIPPLLKNNRSAHLNYINHLKESVETVREIELLEYMISTYPKSFNERDNKAPSTPLTKKKQVNFNDKPKTSTSNTQKHVVQQKVQQSNVPVIPSTRVSSSTNASRSKPKSNTKKNRILPTKSKNKMKVEDHPRTNKSVWTKVNRVESSISSKNVVINSNSKSMCKTCNKCIISANHDMCVIKPLNSVNATPTVKNGLNKVKQVWKVKGKLSANGLNKAKQVWKATGKVFANVGYQWRPIGKMFLLGEQCPLTKVLVKCRTDRSLVSGLRLFKTYDGESFKAQEVNGKSSSGKSDSEMITFELSWVMESNAIISNDDVCSHQFRPRYSS